MSSRNQTFKTLIIFLLFSLAFLKGFINIISNPPFQTADEPMFLEAALVVGTFFPNIFSLNENTCNSFQKPILTVMANHFFFDRIGIPEPSPLPGYFREVPSIRDAPSKIGRQPLFFLLTGVPIRLFTHGILKALYLARCINLGLAFLALFLFYRLLKLRFKDDNELLVFAFSCFVLHPAFWHLGSSMTAESIKVLLVCSGLLLSVDTDRKGLTAWRIFLFIAWFFLVIATTWTLAALALIIVYISIFNAFSKQLPKSKTFGKTALIILAISSVSLIFVISDKKLLFHEIVNFSSGLSNLLSGKTPLVNSISILNMSFWGGFNWLTPSIPPLARICFIGISIAWCLAFFSYVIISLHKKNKESFFKIVVMTVFLWVAFVILRASANESSIQGRYFFPILPIIILGVAEGFRLLKKPILRFFFLLLLTGTTIYGDFSANILGWIPYQHIGYSELKEPARSLSSLSWTKTNGTHHILDHRHSDTSAFLVSGWYPIEPNSSHRWMMNKAKICLPMLSAQDTLLHLDISPFSPPGSASRDLLLEWNSIPIGSHRLQHGKQTYTFGIRKDWIDLTLNTLTLTCGEATSPKDLGLSDDSRMLSIAFHRLEIEPLIRTETSWIGKPGWFLTPETTTFLRLTMGDRIRINRSQSDDHFLTVYSNGNRARSWLTEGQEIEIGETLAIQSIELKQAKRNHVVEKFMQYRASVQNLPAFLCDIYLHLVMQFLWFFLAGAIFMLFFYAFLPFPST